MLSSTWYTDPVQPIYGWFGITESGGKHFVKALDKAHLNLIFQGGIKTTNETHLEKFLVIIQFRSGNIDNLAAGNVTSGTQQFVVPRILSRTHRESNKKGYKDPKKLRSLHFLATDRVTQVINCSKSFLLLKDVQRYQTK